MSGPHMCKDCGKHYQTQELLNKHKQGVSPKKSKEGSLHKRIMDQLWMEIGNAAYTMHMNLYSEGISKVLEEAKADLMLEKPTVDNYELTIPAQQAQYDIDLKRWKKFVRWFGE